LFTPFRLKPKEEWSHNVSFFKFAPREDRQAFSALAKGLKDNITTKRATLPEKSPDVEGDPGVVQPILGMFDANFFWRAGEYQIELHVETDSAKANTKRFFRFTLFESDSDQLKAHRDQLKFGNGVYFRLPPVEPTFVELHQIN